MRGRLISQILSACQETLLVIFICERSKEGMWSGEGLRQNPGIHPYLQGEQKKHKGTWGARDRKTWGSAGTGKAREKQTPICVFWRGWPRDGPGLGLKRGQRKSFFYSSSTGRGRIQIARIVSENDNVEATGKCSLIRPIFLHTWEKFLISGRFRSHFLHRRLFWWIKYRWDGICFSRDYWMKVQAEELCLLLSKLSLTKRHTCLSRATSQRGWKSIDCFPKDELVISSVFLVIYYFFSRLTHSV